MTNLGQFVRTIIPVRSRAVVPLSPIVNVVPPAVGLRWGKSGLDEAAKTIQSSGGIVIIVDGDEDEYITRDGVGVDSAEIKELKLGDDPVQFPDEFSYDTHIEHDGDDSSNRYGGISIMVDWVNVHAPFQPNTFQPPATYEDTTTNSGGAWFNVPAPPLQKNHSLFKCGIVDIPDEKRKTVGNVTIVRPIIYHTQMYVKISNDDSSFFKPLLSYIQAYLKEKAGETSGDYSDFDFIEWPHP
jgi:hypothetical protein